MRLVGNLVDWNGRKACGFIEVPSMGKKYFAHKTEFQIQFSDFQGPPPNLSFVPGMDPKSGKERACQILPEGAYESPMSGMSDEPRLHGVLAQWQPQKACGFIDWDGKRVFAHKSEFELAFPDGAAPPLGSQVSFVLGTDPKSGKERACSIRLQAGSMPAAAMRRQQPQRSFFGGGCCGGCGGCGGYGGYGGCGGCGGCGGGCCGYGGGCMHGGCMGGCGGGCKHGGCMGGSGCMGGGCMGGCCGGPVVGRPVVGHMPAMQPMVQFQAAAMRQRANGILCEWNDEKACGFIECAMEGGKKLFCHKSDFVELFEDGQGPAVGTTMNFVLGVDPRSGKQRAKEIGIGAGSGGSVDGPRLFGTLVDWKPDKACGFLQCAEAGGKKYFAHKSEFAEPFLDGEEPAMGTGMTFVHGFDAKSGRERAQDIRIQDKDGLRLFGSLCEWRDEKACGFIEAETGKRYFAHKTEFVDQFSDGGAPGVGTEMSFMPGFDAKSGRERATEIRIEDGGLKRSSLYSEIPSGKRPRA